MTIRALRAPTSGPFAAALAAALVVAWACSSSTAANTPPAGQEAKEAAQVIDHLVPRRDFVGPMPQRFEWTAAKGADHYAIGVWDEVDRLRWRKDDIQGTSVTRPPDVDLESGTYYWSVSGLRGGQQIADSGLSAFVVER